ncbi:DoxX family protein [Chryseobacterium gambrini]|uniref:DoxX-like family protein n=1 Tax=Chryseobacterium gambrini TaxID=373672 RepID=A0A1N7MKI8_9FLAO|nr:DoxX family protein [Chryseobacterium gambrini]SIS86666.1 DoxX-like family protein [Chryseobacterium gambrini]
MNNEKTKKIAAVIMTVLVTLMVGISGLMKVIQLPWSVEGMIKLNLSNSTTSLGLLEMSFIFLFAYPKTMRIGFILISCYFGGAMATELSHDGSMINPAIPMILIWITALLRDSSIFFGSNDRLVK